jgi:hypothetical protein
LIEQIGDLFRAELRLARSEVTSGIASARGAAVAIAVGATFLTASLLAFLGAMVGWLAPYVGGPGWAAFIVGVAAAVLGGISIMVGVGKLKAIRISPERTLTRLKRDAEALKGDD